MSGTTNGTKPVSIVAVLKRADQRWAKDQESDPADPAYLDHLATFLQPVVKADDVKPADERDFALLREQAAAAETSAAKRQAELDQARAQIDHLNRLIETKAVEADRRVKDVLAEKNRVETERDHLKQLLTEARQATQEPAVDLNKVRDQAKLIRKLRDDYDAALADHQKAAGELADELASARTEVATMQTERDQLAERLGAATSHRCTWQWHGPDEPVKPCACGRPVPRYELREVG